MKLNNLQIEMFIGNFEKFQSYDNAILLYWQLNKI